MSLSTIDAFNYLLKVALNKEIPELQLPIHYFKVLQMLKHLEIKEKCKLRLLVIIFEEMFVHNSKMIITKKERKINKFIHYCKAQLIPENLKNSPNLPTIKKLFEFIELKEDELLLVSFLMINNKKPSLYYKIIDALFSAKNKNYIRNEKIKIDDNTNYVTFIECVINSIIKYKKENHNSHFIFFYNNNEFRVIKLSKEEAEEYCNSHNQLKPLRRDEVLKYIKENAKKTKSNVNNKMEIELNEEKEILKDEIYELQNPKNESKKNTISELKKEISELQLPKTEKKNTISESKKEKCELEIPKTEPNKSTISELLKEICVLQNPETEQNKSSLSEFKKELDEFKNKKIYLDQKICELNGEIGAFKNNKISLDKKIYELNGVINDLKEKIVVIEKDSERSETDIFEEFKEKLNFSILKLKKDIEGLKGINNDLNIKLDNSINEMEKLGKYLI